MSSHSTKIFNRGTNTNLVVSLYYLFKMLPMLVAGLAIYLGYRLFIMGVTGQASLSIESKTVGGQLVNAAPGLFFAIGGIVTLIICVWRSASIQIGDEKTEAGHKDQKPAV